MPVPATLSLRAAFILLHVDGSASLQRIALMTSLSLPETIEAFLQLMVLGVVSVEDDEPRPSTVRRAIPSSPLT